MFPKGEGGRSVSLSILCPSRAILIISANRFIFIHWTSVACNRIPLLYTGILTLLLSFRSLLQERKLSLDKIGNVKEERWLKQTDVQLEIYASRILWDVTHVGICPFLSRSATRSHLTYYKKFSNSHFLSELVSDLLFYQSAVSLHKNSSKEIYLRTVSLILYLSFSLLLFFIIFVFLSFSIISFFFLFKTALRCIFFL